MRYKLDCGHSIMFSADGGVYSIDESEGTTELRPCCALAYAKSHGGSATAAYEDRLKFLEDRVVKLESGQQRSYSIIAYDLPGKTRFYRKDLTLAECRFFYKDLMRRRFRAEDPEISHPDDEFWEIEVVFGPNGDCSEEFLRWHVQTVADGEYINEAMKAIVND